MTCFVKTKMHQIPNIHQVNNLSQEYILHCYALLSEV